MHGKRMTEALNEVRSFRDTTEGGPGSGPQKGGKKFSSSEIKKAYGILNDPRYKQGNYTGAAKAINKLAPGLADHPDVKNAMKRANEEIEEERSYTVIHTKHGKEVVKANGTYDAAQKYAKMKGLKDTSGVDAHLMEEIEETMVVTKVDKDTNSPAYQKFKAGDKRYVYKENLDLSATGDTTTSNASQENETVELDEAAFSQAQIDSLKKAYGDFSSTGVSMKNMDKLKATMKRYSKNHLSQLAKLDIPMVSKTAKELL